MKPLRTCLIPECSKAPRARVYCQRHYDQINQRVANGGQQGQRLTDDQIAEIRRRITRFENPMSIARSMGISHVTVRRYAKKGADR